jgi:hypothetical protein
MVMAAPLFITTASIPYSNNFVAIIPYWALCPKFQY